MSYLATKYGVTSIVKPYCDMTTYKPPREEVLTHLADIRRHINTLENLYYVLDGCKASVSRVSNWSVDISVYLRCLSFAVPIDRASFPSSENYMKWIYGRSCALILLSKTPNVTKLNVPGGRQTWDEVMLGIYENAKLGLSVSWRSLANCFRLEDLKLSVMPNVWAEWVKSCESSFSGDYISSD